jgi:hypothetical protein
MGSRRTARRSLKLPGTSSLQTPASRPRAWARSHVRHTPGSAEIALANQGIDVLLPGIMVTAVDFIADRKVKLVRC